MALTLAEIITHTRTQIDETNATPILTDGQITHFVNRRYHEMEDIIRDANEDYFTKTSTINLVSGTELYDLPEDANGFSEVARIIRVEVSYDGSNYNLADYTTIQKRVTTEDNTDGAYAFTFPEYYLLGDQIGFLPIPNSSSGVVKLWYSQSLPDLANSSDVSLMPLRYDRLIALGAAIGALRKDFYFVEAERLKDDYYNNLKRVQQHFKPRAETGIKNVQYRARRSRFSPEHYVRRGSLS